MSYVIKNCANVDCGKSYKADLRNVNRGWGLTCSKSCAAKNREKSKPGYDPKKVEINNRLRKGIVLKEDFFSLPLDRQNYIMLHMRISDEIFENLSIEQKMRYNQEKFGEYAPNIIGGSGRITGITSEGYRIMDNIAYDEFDDPMYGDAEELNDEDRGWDSHK